MITIEKILKAENAYTHAGVFHADDVFSSALIKMINSDIHIIRTFNPPNDKDAIVFDIGGGRYDHHGEKEYRQLHDGSGNDYDHPYAAFGKLWKDIGKDIMNSDTLADNIDKALCWDIDATDNYGQSKHPNQLSYAISLFNPEWNSLETEDACFNKAVSFALEILRKAVNKELSKEEAKSIVLSSEIVDNHILMLDSFVPWKGTIMRDNADKFAEKIKEINDPKTPHVTTSIYNIDKSNVIAFALYPSQRGGWNLETVPSIETYLSCKNSHVVVLDKIIKENTLDMVKQDISEFVVPLKSSKDNCRSADDFEGCTFLHASGFLSSFDTKEHALECAKGLISDYELDGKYRFSESRQIKSNEM